MVRLPRTPLREMRAVVFIIDHSKPLNVESSFQLARALICLSKVSLAWAMHSVVVSTPPHPLNGDTSWVFVQLESAGKALVDLLELVEL